MSARRFPPAFLLAVFAAACVGAVSTSELITQSDLLQRLGTPTPPLVLDVRSPDEFRSGHVPTAVNIPHLQLGARIDELAGAKERDVVVYCEAGPRAEYAESVLKQNGFRRVLHLEGDMRSWRMNRLPVTTD